MNKAIRELIVMSTFTILALNACSTGVVPTGQAQQHVYPSTEAVLAFPATAHNVEAAQ